mgnify:FL=1
MPVAGLVLTLADDTPASLMAALAHTPGISLGEPCGARLPVVLEAESPQALDAVLYELGARPGVLRVELAFAELSDLEPLTDYEQPRRERSHVGGDDGPT